MGGLVLALLLRGRVWVRVRVGFVLALLAQHEGALVGLRVGLGLGLGLGLG